LAGRFSINLEHVLYNLHGAAAVYCRILGEEEFVAVLFYEEKKRESMKALQHLEMIDDEADLFSIRQGPLFQTKYFFPVSVTLHLLAKSWISGLKLRFLLHTSSYVP
jgi:hypothetical protein